jgi:uncharacterized protein YkwD
MWPVNGETDDLDRPAARHRRPRPPTARALALVALLALAIIAAYAVARAAWPLGHADPASASARSAPTSTSAPLAEPETPVSTGSRTPGPTPERPSSGGGLTVRERRTLDIANRERADKGCPALAMDKRLMVASRRHAADMVDRGFFSHTSPDGTNPSQRARSAGFPGGAGENIAAGYPSPATVMSRWMGSKPHRANILNCRYTVMGIGYAPGRVQPEYGPGTWVQMFGALD